MTPSKPCIARRVRYWHGRNMTDGEIAQKIGASIQRVTATRIRLGLAPHILMKSGVRKLNVSRKTEAGKFRPGHKMSEEQIMLLYAGRRYA